jgi:capsule polysaccharide export protein KpsC/LpsZ
MREYLALAVEAGIVEIGGADGQAWVRLHPDVLSGKRTFHVA